MNIVNVKVCGMEYNLKGDEREEYLHMVAGFVDKKVRMITEKNPKLSISAATVLAAINVADEFFKYSNYIEELENKSAILESSQKSMRSIVDNLKKQVEELNEEKKVLLENNTSESEEITNIKEQLKSAQEELREYKEQITKSNGDEEFIKLKAQYEVLEEEAKKYKNRFKKLEAINKEMRFSLSSSKYKILELETKFNESQIQLAVEKRKNSGNILLK
ncbi:MAG: cell division protein ZapA [Clostridiaceae bacterium]